MQYIPVVLFLELLSPLRFELAIKRRNAYRNTHNRRQRNWQYTPRHFDFARVRAV
jgi:hypothetical protein|tara:strand:+ start:6582 stop:6746 length:165 start_codon:yes stop_codon:yes gene_type:complete